MEEKKVRSLTRELKLREFQFNSIFEFSEAIYTSFEVDSIVRIFFSTIMGQLGVSKAFVFDSEHHLLRKRGFVMSDEEIKLFQEHIKTLGGDWFWHKTDELPPELQQLAELLSQKKIRHLVNISETDKKVVVLGLCDRMTGQELTNENIEYCFVMGKFAVSGIDNALMVKQLIEKKRLEHEINIARDIQKGLLPQEVPELENFEISVIYEPTNEVGGDYYDILKWRKDRLPVLIADVEGKGLSAALLAASSQAVFHSLNELYFFEPCKFIAKANEMIYDFTRGNRFITLFWMLVNDQTRDVTYVNAGHEAPYLLSGDSVSRLSKGGFLTGFMETAEYEKETVTLQSGDIIAAFTDGVPEVENPEGDEFGLDYLVKFIQERRDLSAMEITSAVFAATKEFSRGKKFRDDFTLIILKAK